MKHIFPSAEVIKELQESGAVVALFDSDIPCYSVAAMAENEVNASSVERTTDNFMFRVKRDTKATHYISLMTDGKSNFRNDVALTAPYKGNRAKLERPKWYSHIKDYTVSRWHGQIMFGIEADDALTLCAKYLMAHGIKCIICTLDKDLRQFPGWHYNWDSRKLEYIEWAKGEYNLWKQVLMGDMGTDNIPGLSDAAWCPTKPYKQPVFENYLKVPECPQILASGQPSKRKMSHVNLVGWEEVTDLTYVKGLSEFYYGPAMVEELFANVEPEDYPTVVLNEFISAYWEEGVVQELDDPGTLGEQRFLEVFRLVYMLRDIEEIPNDAVIDFTPLTFQARVFNDFEDDEDTASDDPDFDF